MSDVPKRLQEGYGEKLFMLGPFTGEQVNMLRAAVLSLTRTHQRFAAWDGLEALSGLKSIIDNEHDYAGDKS